MQYKEEGNRFFREGQWKKAIEQYTKGLQGGGEEELPADVRGLLLSNRSQCRLNLHEWQAAFEDADACLRLLPSHTKSLFRRATAYEHLGKKAEAVADFVKVAKAEPQNKPAVEAARRLREDVMRSTEQQRDEALPANVLDVLRNRSDGSAEDKVDACKKLRALCVHKGLSRSLFKSGTLDLLVELVSTENTEPELRASALGVLMVMASGHETKDEDEKAATKRSDVNSPIEVAPAAADARRRLRELLPIDKLRAFCRSHAKAMQEFALLLGYVYEPEDADALEALSDALLFTEGAEVSVARAAILALSSMCDVRRRQGKNGKPLMPTASLLKCVESALGCTSCADPLKHLMAIVFTLLADKDRPKNAEIDLANVGLKILEPFLQTQDVALQANGLSGLSALFAASSEAATTLLHSSPVPLSALLGALSRPQPSPEGRLAQSHAAECLLLTTGNVKTRQNFIDGGGIDMLLGALGDGEEGSKGLIRAKLMGVLAMLAAHNKEVREEVFDRLDFLMELRHALDVARESALAARAGGTADTQKVEDARRLARGFYESCACLTIHGEFKELLRDSKKTLKAIHDLVSPEDLAEDKHIAFMYTSIMANICRSREDKIRPKKDQFPFNELGEDDLNALEEFMEKMPAESRPVKNGELDAGSAELANDLRVWCVKESGKSLPRPVGGVNPGGERARAAAASSVVSNLSKCTANGTSRVQNLAALIMKTLCASKEHRGPVVSSGGFRLLLGLVDIEDEVSRDAARQALAQICIVTNPMLFTYGEQLDAVRPLVELCEHKHELLQFEAAMGLTNLLTVSDELRTRALQADAWRVCKDLLFSENEMVQRAGIETMCNFTMADEIIERFATGKASVEIDIFCAFCLTEDKATQRAASGALAMIAGCEEVAVQIAKSEKFGCLLQFLEEVADADLQHRAVACVCSIADAEGVPENVRAQIKEKLRAKRSGLVSGEAESIASALLG